MASTRAKKKDGGARPSAAEQFGVVVEEIRSQFKVFGESLEGLREQVVTGFDRVDRRFEQVDARLDQVDGRLDQIDGRLDQIDGRLDQVDGRLDQIDGRLDQVDGRLDKVENEMVLLKEATLENGRGLKDVRTAVERLTEKVDRKVDRAEVQAVVEEALAPPGSH
jgi:chromosome segregation ATPase